MILGSSSKYFSSLQIILHLINNPKGTLFSVSMDEQLKCRYCLLSEGLWYNFVSM